MPGHSFNVRHARHWARRLAMQALYQWQLTGQNLCEIEAQFLDYEDMHKADIDYFRELLHRVPACLHELDAQLGAYLSRPINDVDPVERAILRNACYELMHRLDVPYRVVINEAVNLTKRFGAEQGHKFVNGVLDKLVTLQRKQEVDLVPNQV
jgi:N utilization substance protein B